MERQEPEVLFLEEGEIDAIVGKIHTKGVTPLFTPFAVAYPRDKSIANGRDITFSLKNWKGNACPCEGEIVILGDVRLFAKGWRALYARPVSLVQSQKEKK